MNLVLVTKKVLSEDELLLVVEGLVSVAVEEGVAPSKSSPYSELVLRSTKYERTRTQERGTALVLHYIVDVRDNIWEICLDGVICLLGTTCTSKILLLESAIDFSIRAFQV